MATEVTNTTTAFPMATNMTGVPVVTDKEQDEYRTYKILSAVLVVAVLIIGCGVVYALYRKFCRSHINKHGVERTEDGIADTPKGKREYYDQFGCDTNELTVNSVTALKWDKDEKAPWATGLSRSKSSGIECDANSVESKEIERINTGKRVFQVNKVSEKQPVKPASPGQYKVLRIPKGLANAARSLQASDGKNFSLAIIDKNSQTIHNIDLRNYRARTRGKSPLASEVGAKPNRLHVTTGGRRRLHSTGDEKYKRGTRSDCEMVHDSPDFVWKMRGTVSADEYVDESTASLTEESSTSTQRASSSLSSDEAEGKAALLSEADPQSGEEDHAGTKLLG